MGFGNSNDRRVPSITSKNSFNKATRPPLYNEEQSHNAFVNNSIPEDFNGEVDLQQDSNCWFELKGLVETCQNEKNRLRSKSLEFTSEYLPADTHDMVIAKRNRHLRIGRGNLNVMGNVNLMGLSMAAQNFNSGKKRHHQQQNLANSFANEMPGNTSLLQLNNAIGDGDDGVREDGIFNTSQLNTSKVLLDTSINLNNSQVMFNKLNESEYLQGESANVSM